MLCISFAFATNSVIPSAQTAGLTKFDDAPEQCEILRCSRDDKQESQSGPDSKGSVECDHSIGSTAVLVESDVGAIEIKGAIGLVASFGIE